MKDRFRGFLPVVVDVETGGFDERINPLLEIAAITLTMDEAGLLKPDTVRSTHVIAFEGSVNDPKSLEINGIDPDNPLRAARAEKEALNFIFGPVRDAVRDSGCQRAILVGHNAFFDLKFVNAAAERAGIRRNPFHPFSCFDTVSLAGLAYGQTVLARAAQAAGLGWDTGEAHSALYDTRQTAALFCDIVNRWEAAHGGAPLPGLSASAPAGDPL